jgi:hypothetical protein
MIDLSKFENAPELLSEVKRLRNTLELLCAEMEGIARALEKNELTGTAEIVRCTILARARKALEGGAE